MNALWGHFAQIRDYLDAGGVVMIPLLSVSLLMWALIINRAIFFRRLHRRNMPRERAGHFVRTAAPPPFKRYRGITALFVTEFLARRTGDRPQDRRVLDEIVMSLSLSLDRHLIRGNEGNAVSSSHGKPARIRIWRIKLDSCMLAGFYRSYLVSPSL